MKKILVLPIAVLIFGLGASLALAHAVVSPKQAGVAAFQEFTLAVPSEKPVATTSIRLVLPDGLQFVTLNVKPGWKVEVKTQATGKTITDDDGKTVDEQKPVEIDWSGGNIPADQRDDFLFSAKVPSQTSTLNWKVYQTYADGSVVSWDGGQGSDTPYSTTKIVDDLTSTQNDSSKSTQNQNGVAITIGLIALVLSLAALFRPRRNS